MNIQKIVFFIIFTCLQQQVIDASSEIIQTDTINAILEYVEAPTDLVILDLDETLITLKYGEHWINALCQHHGITDFKNVEEFYVWHAMHDEHHLLESYAPQIIAKLQKQRNVVMALTARSTFSYIKITHEILRDLGIDFDRNDIPEVYFDISVDRPAFYYRGIISAGNNNKGVALMQALDQLHLRPTKIIFMDDKLHHLQAVASHAAARNIPFVGLHIKHAQSKCSAVSEVDHKHYADWLNGDLVFG